MSYLAGFDVGTHGVRALAFDISSQTIVASERTNYSRNISFGVQEMSPTEMWDAFVLTCHKLSQSLGEGSRIKAISITHQRGTVIPVDQNLNSLANAMCDSDLRAIEKDDLIAYGTSSREYYRTSGCPFLSFNGSAKILWCRENDKDLFCKAYAWLSPQDYLVSRLCGSIRQSAGSALRNGIYDVNIRGLSENLFPVLGEEQINSHVPCYEPGTYMGLVQADISSILPILTNAIIIASPGDQPAAVLGTGVVGSRDCAINLGTTFVVSVVSNSLIYDSDEKITNEILPEKLFAPEFGTGAGGQYVDWFAPMIVDSVPEESKAWRLLEDLAEKIPVGSNRLTTVPMLWQVTSQEVKGRIEGLTSSHTKAHFVRSMYEGLAYEIKIAINKLEGVGAQIGDAVRVFGGMANSTLFLKILANVICLPVKISTQKQASAFGALICAGRATGSFNSICDLTEWILPPPVIIEPNYRESIFYDQKYYEYCESR